MAVFFSVFLLISPFCSHVWVFSCSILPISRLKYHHIYVFPFLFACFYCPYFVSVVTGHRYLFFFALFKVFRLSLYRCHHAIDWGVHFHIFKVFVIFLFSNILILSWFGCSIISVVSLFQHKYGGWSIF